MLQMLLNIHKCKCMSQRLSQKAAGTGHTNLNNRCGDLTVWDRWLFCNLGNKVLLKSSHRAQEREGSGDGRNSCMKKMSAVCPTSILFSSHSHIHICRGSWVFTGSVIYVCCAAQGSPWRPLPQTSSTVRDHTHSATELSTYRQHGACLPLGLIIPF